MRFNCKTLLICGLFLLAFPFNSPAPIIYTPGEGWVKQGAYPNKDNPKDQLEFAQEIEQKEPDEAIPLYRFLIKRWPTSAQASEAQFGMGRAYEGMREYYKAYKQYERFLNRYPNSSLFNEALQRVFEIGNRFLAGERVKLWKFKTFPSMDKTVEIYETILKTGPFSPIAAQAQFNIGLARLKQKDYTASANALLKVVEKYPRHELVDDAAFEVGNTYYKASKSSEYDQSFANKAALALSDFMLKYPDSPLIEKAKNLVKNIENEQARGLFAVGEYYEYKTKNPGAALIYYNSILTEHPSSSFADDAKKKIAHLQEHETQATEVASETTEKSTKSEDMKDKRGKTSADQVERARVPTPDKQAGTEASESTATTTSETTSPASTSSTADTSGFQGLPADPGAPDGDYADFPEPKIRTKKSR